MSIVDAEDLSKVYTSFSVSIISLSQQSFLITWYHTVQLRIYCRVPERANMEGARQLGRHGRWESHQGNCTGWFTTSVINAHISGPHCHRLLPLPCFAPASGLCLLNSNYSLLIPRLELLNQYLCKDRQWVVKAFLYLHYFLQCHLKVTNISLFYFIF